MLNRAGYASPVRTPRGRDIMAACGQLKSESQKLPREGADGAGARGALDRRAYFAAASIASSRVLRPVVGDDTSTAMLPGRCSFFHIFMWALGMSAQE